MPAQPEIDIRQHSAQTRSRMVRIGLVLIVVLAVVLIAAVYGLPAAGVGALCLAGGLLAMVAVAGVLWLIRFIVTRAGYDE